MKRTTNKPLNIGLVVALDILLGGAILLSFTFFHHVLPRILPAKDAETEAVFTKAPNTGGPVSGAFTGDYTAPSIPGITSPAPATSDDGPVTGPVTTEPVTPPEPVYDLSGDFGYKFAPLFAQDDRIYQDATTYQSHDIYMTLRSFDGTAKQLTKRGGDSYSDSHVVYHVMDIYVRNIENLFCPYQNKQVPANSLYNDPAFGKSVAGISGDLFYGYKEAKPVIVRNGIQIRTADYIADDICVLYFDGTMETVTPEEYNWNAIKAKGPYQIWSFGPALLNDGKINKEMKTAVWPKNPRAAIGYVEPGHYVLVSVNGIREESERATHGDGANMDFLAQIMADAGCKVAYNLDGGASVYAYWGDTRLVEINGGKRDISDMICIGEVGGN